MITLQILLSFVILVPLKSNLVCSSLPNIERAYTGQRVLLKDLSGYPSLPLAKICLESELVSGPVLVRVVDGPLPVKEVQFLLGNDLAGTLVVPNPVVTESPIPETTSETERLPPELFPSCAVTWSQSGKLQNTEEESSPSLTDSKLLPITKANLIKSQGNDPTLTNISRNAVEKKDLVSNPGFYFDDKLLMRRYRPLDSPLNEDWSEVHQIVIPRDFRDYVISLAHDGIHGHLGIHKIYHKILAHFYWPGLRSDVSRYITFVS